MTDYTDLIERLRNCDVPYYESSLTRMTGLLADIEAATDAIEALQSENEALRRDVRESNPR